MRVTDGAMLRARVLAALLRVRPKANFHRNNDRKSECGMQGCAHCGLSRFFASGESKARRKVRRKEAGRLRIVYVVAALQSLRVKSHDPQRILSASQNPNPSHTKVFGTPASFRCG